MVRPSGLPPAFAFTTRRGLAPAHSRLWATPWSVFQDGPLVAIMPASLLKARSSDGAGELRSVL